MLNGAQIHLLVNHFPVITPVLAVLFCLLSFVLKDTKILNGAAALLVIGGLAAIPSYLSGEPAEHLVKDHPGVTQELIEEHEESAEIAAIVLGLAGAAAFGFLFMTARGVIVPFAQVGLLVASLVSAGFMASAAHKGGLIHHEEIRDSGKVPNAHHEQNEDRD